MALPDWRRGSTFIGTLYYWVSAITDKILATSQPFKKQTDKKWRVASRGPLCFITRSKQPTEENCDVSQPWNQSYGSAMNVQNLWVVNVSVNIRSICKAEKHSTVIITGGNIRWNFRYLPTLVIYEVYSFSSKLLYQILSDRYFWNCIFAFFLNFDAAV